MHLKFKKISSISGTCKYLRTPSSNSTLIQRRPLSTVLHLNNTHTKCVLGSIKRLQNNNTNNSIVQRREKIHISGRGWAEGFYIEQRGVIKCAETIVLYACKSDDRKITQHR